MQAKNLKYGSIIMVKVIAYNAIGSGLDMKGGSLDTNNSDAATYLGYSFLGNSTYIEYYSVTDEGSLIDYYTVQYYLYYDTEYYQRIIYSGDNSTMLKLEDMFTPAVDFYDGLGTILSGNDKITGNKYADKIKGFAGKDKLYGGSGNDTLKGGKGKDKLYGEKNNDKLYGGSSNDTLEGGSGKDKLYGEKNDDKLYGGSSNDTLKGGKGKDKLYGGSSKDTLKGGSGKDRLDGGTGNDKLFGGSGADTFVFNKKSGKDTIEDFGGNDVIAITNGVNRLRDIDFTDTKAGLLIEFGKVDIFLEDLDRKDITLSDFDFG